MTDPPITTSGYIEVASFFGKISQKRTLLWIANWNGVRCILLRSDESRALGEGKQDFALLIHEQDYFKLKRRIP